MRFSDMAQDSLSNVVESQPFGCYLVKYFYIWATPVRRECLEEKLLLSLMPVL